MSFVHYFVSTRLRLHFEHLERSQREIRHLGTHRALKYLVGTWALGEHSSLTLFRMGGKKAPSSFSPVTSTNVGISSQNFLTFSFNPFDRLM